MLRLRIFDSCSAAKVCIYEHNARNIQSSDAFTIRPLFTQLALSADLSIITLSEHFLPDTFAACTISLVDNINRLQVFLNYFLKHSSL